MADPSDPLAPKPVALDPDGVSAPAEPLDAPPAPGDAIAALAAPAPGDIAPGLTSASAPAEDAPGRRPSYVFFGAVAAASLLCDICSKAWAEIVLGSRTMLDPALVILQGHLTLTLAYNKGGAWGLLQDASEKVRMPFFLAVSVLAIGFIVSLYGRLAPGQRALSWGLPLVLGGALGNLSDRIVRSSVIDFIDYRADWVRTMNELVARLHPTWSVTDHWPTFNVADISICVGVGFMAIDMLTARRGPKPEPVVVPEPAPASPGPSEPLS
jgi:signal peptidase II